MEIYNKVLTKSEHGVGVESGNLSQDHPWQVCREEGNHHEAQPSSSLCVDQWSWQRLGQMYQLR